MTNDEWAGARLDALGLCEKPAQPVQGPRVGRGVPSAVEGILPDSGRRRGGAASENSPRPAYCSLTLCLPAGKMPAGAGGTPAGRPPYPGLLRQSAQRHREAAVFAPAGRAPHRVFHLRAGGAWHRQFVGSDFRLSRARDCISSSVVPTCR
jgi:hypothetical protein